MTDPDTDDEQLIYEITAGPRNGHVENKLKPGTAVTTFTQEDVNQGLIRYVAHEEMVQETADSFQFLVKDSKLNVVSGNVFHVQRSLLSFTHGSYEVRESAGSVSVAVRRVGNLNRYSIVLCRTEQGTATAGAASRPGEQDYVEYAGQVQFEEREDTKACHRHHQRRRRVRGHGELFRRAQHAGLRPAGERHPGHRHRRGPRGRAHAAV
ncbi:extracellular matrix protein FRAS1-like [Cyanistes caeruleus]|uniref:extracellular matrix protein FRAS1-like n=1 Tax=Cyanistes caeruleus TaxID=156563 RepID=UPI000CDB1931|nr:extracellular matrix protein FRAS1-like [Cyanistes caeruleus]